MGDGANFIFNLPKKYEEKRSLATRGIMYYFTRCSRLSSYEKSEINTYQQLRKFVVCFCCYCVLQLNDQNVSHVTYINVCCN